MPDNPPIRGCKCGCDERAEAERLRKRCEFVRSRVNPEGTLSSRVVVRATPLPAQRFTFGTKQRDLLAERHAAERLIRGESAR